MRQFEMLSSIRNLFEICPSRSRIRPHSFDVFEHLLGNREHGCKINHQDFAPLIDG